MAFYRMVGALILAISGGVGAYLMNRSASAALTQVEGWISFLRYVKLQVECFSLPISVILKRCDPNIFRGCGYFLDVPPENLEELVQRCSVRDETNREIIDGFAKDFGKSYREEQIRRCEYYLSLLEARRNFLVTQLPMKKKLNSTLCIAGALAIVILLI